MRPQKIQDEDLLAALAHVFRQKGYEGASLKELSEATGLQKASLYHRFPNGKQEMAESVLEHLGRWVDDNIFSALNKAGIPPKIRLKNGLNQIAILYNGGNEPCIFRALSMETGFELFDQILTKGMKDWIQAFKKLGLSMGQPVQLAEENAIQTLIEIQGSLILGKGMQDTTIFRNTLLGIENRYT